VSDERLRLNSGRLLVEVAPSCGGSITRFDYIGGNCAIPLFRRCEEEMVLRRSALGASCFPLIPYSNRLREGRFKVGDRILQHELNCLPERHSSHGDGWMRQWAVSHFDDSRIEMYLGCDARQPVQYTARQEIHVGKDVIRVRLCVTNKDSFRAPFGIGIHPYFADPRGAHLRCSLESEWTLDDELMPVKCVDNARFAEMKEGIRVLDLPEIGAFTGSCTDARISWPSAKVSLRCETSPPMKHAIIWRPEKGEFFCYEPVSHMIDGFNMATLEVNKSGIKFLESGDRYESTWRFSVLSDVEPLQGVVPKGTV